MTDTELKEPVDWLLDEIEQVTALLPLDDPDFDDKLARLLIAMKLSLHRTLMIYWRRPDAMKKRKRLWDYCRDLTSGIEGGHFPKPFWYDSLKQACENRRPVQIDLATSTHKWFPPVEYDEADG